MNHPAASPLPSARSIGDVRSICGTRDTNGTNGTNGTRGTRGIRGTNGTRRIRGMRTTLVLALTAILLAAGCVGSGKTARSATLEPLPDGMSIVADITMGCRDGESGFDYRFVVIGPTSDLSNGGRLLTTLRDRGFYHSIAIPDDLPWMTVGYQMKEYPLRAEIGPLPKYLANPVAREGPPVDSLPAQVRAHPDEYVLIAMRPTDFGCTTPL